MAETGWPLIPRDALPTSAPAVAKAVRRAPVAHHDGGRQLPIFGAETTEPSPSDLAGLLAGPGRLDRMGGTARVSVQVDAAWRVHVLVAELVARGLVVNWRPVEAAGRPDDAAGRPVDAAGRPVDAAGTRVDAAGTRVEVAGRPADAAEGHADTAQRRHVQNPEAGVRAGHAPPEPGVPGPGVSADANPVQDHGPASETPEGRRIGAGGKGRSDGAGRSGRYDGAPGEASRDGGGDDRDAQGGTRREAQGGTRREAQGGTGREAQGGTRRDAQGGTGRDAHGGTGREAQGGSGLAGERGEERVGQVGPSLHLFEVRTAYSSRLNDLARAWPAAADQLFLSGPRLRLWVSAAGRPVEGGYALGLGSDNPHITVDAAMRRAGLDGEVSDHGLDYLISGRKRLERLAELVGERPAAAPVGVWPGGAGA